jgi:hypothetical protein
MRFAQVACLQGCQVACLALAREYPTRRRPRLKMLLVGLEITFRVLLDTLLRSLTFRRHPLHPLRHLDSHSYQLGGNMNFLLLVTSLGGRPANAELPSGATEKTNDKHVQDSRRSAACPARLRGAHRLRRGAAIGTASCLRHAEPLTVSLFVLGLQQKTLKNQSSSKRSPAGGGGWVSRCLSGVAKPIRRSAELIDATIDNTKQGAKED